MKNNYLSVSLFCRIVLGVRQYYSRVTASLHLKEKHFHSYSQLRSLSYGSFDIDGVLFCDCKAYSLLFITYFQSSEIQRVVLDSFLAVLELHCD